jgi:hypothetical protein
MSSSGLCRHQAKQSYIQKKKKKKKISKRDAEPCGPQLCSVPNFPGEKQQDI